jgi:segregation and condensation protein A
MVETHANWLEEEKPVASADDEVMYVDVNGYEGPLDLLLELARRQKVDLVNVSVLALAEQYLAFIETVREKRIEIAADYLVMAAWLAYLKSRLMVPKLPSDDEPSGEMMAAMLQFRLKRLEAMRKVGGQLINRPRLGRQVFCRGNPEPIQTPKNRVWDVGLYELLKAYAVQREATVASDYVPEKRTVWALNDAKDTLYRLIGDACDWVSLDQYLVQYLSIPEERATVMASSFSASLEMVREGHVELRQSSAFGPLFVRRKRDSDTRNGTHD